MTSWGVPALKVRQWLVDWDSIRWQSDQRRSKPPRWFYQFSLPAAELRQLSGVYPRSTKGRTRANQDLGIQRSHDARRSDEIGRYVRYGFPCSNLSDEKRRSQEHKNFASPVGCRLPSLSIS